ncbi:hypothetical protein FLP41_09440 [Paracoccus marcusii]|uniref:hypothetical protein n=1 Tax=Paracoccus marcusii TaxID=59779 RepID=UPI002ED4AEE3|nr:hypothetical protein FLP41_09440 [Paracoccus marcusii]
MTLSDRLLSEPEQARRPSDGAGEAVPVETVAVQTARFVDSVRAVGTARARSAVELMPEASGRITRIAFAPARRSNAAMSCWNWTTVPNRPIWPPPRRPWPRPTPPLPARNS